MISGSDAAYKVSMICGDGREAVLGLKHHSGYVVADCARRWATRLQCFEAFHVNITDTHCNAES